MDWDKLRVFHACAEAGSFTKASTQLKITQSAISRQISALEYTINMQLFTRHARGLILTEQGEALYKMTHDIMRQLDNVQEILSDLKNKPRGILRITTSFGLGTYWLTAKMVEFQKLYKDINLELILSDTETDLRRRHADCAIRLYKPHQLDIIHKYLFTIDLHIYASVNYIKQNGIPDSLDDIAKHPIISYGESVPPLLKNLNRLEELISDKSKPRLRINNLGGIKTAIKSGLGIGLMPNYMVNAEDDLVAILPNKPITTGFPTYFCYHESLKNSARVKAFNEFISNKAKNWPS